MKRFGERSHSAKLFCFVEKVWTVLTGDEEYRDLRLMFENACNYLKATQVFEKKIDNTESKAMVACLLNSFAPFSYEHDIITVRLKNQPERVAHGGLIVNNENADLFAFSGIKHCLSS